MIVPRFKKILLVAPDGFPAGLTAECKGVKHITKLTSVFPSIFDFNPDLILFDFEFAGDDLEKILRRIKFNKFYQNIKIYCYKKSPNEKSDSFLKILGVDHIIYLDNLAKPQKNKSVFNYLGTVLDTSILKWAANFS